MIDVTKFVDTLYDRPIAVLGLGVSNVAAVKALVKAGADVVVWDDKEENREKSQAPVRDLVKEDLSNYACLVLAPGISHDHPVVVKARDAEIEILCDIEILDRCDHGRKTIGITGTNGKSTTTALIGHILNENGIKAAIGGNIGKPVLGLTLPPKSGVIVMEMSSFQLELCPVFSPDIGILLNLTPDHLDRHKTMENYAAAKTRIFRGSGKAIIGLDDDGSKKIFKIVESEAVRECFPISTTGKLKQGVYAGEGVLYDALEGEPVKISDLTIPALPGVHNHQNIAAAYTAARLTGLAPDAIMQAMQSFPGLQHRQFLTRTINGVAYVNDSKATNAAATARALASYQNIYWIAGGRPKEGGLEGLEPYTEHIHHAFLIGEAMDDFGQWLEKHNVPYRFCETLDKAVMAAHHLAQGERGQPGGTGMVLLSPACASFDQFKNFEARGDMFTKFVMMLEEGT
ncbi:MAG: UDP-N-acetylmuramoyl-L-alanine--D-glutamate ligase [Alphaproteobacteria bacterium CG_4_9_14_3_um_filter_47_13]|nr:MAG: UDP-N-acetylmuramoyl-L-alanine--D-glutamate ligase [Alphaproteobacteria bacterium CG_4_9_14_3_um_filter_47_13]